MSSAVIVAVLVAGGVWLVLQRDLLRAALGFLLFGHAGNVVLLAAGGTERRGPAIIGDAPPEMAADPLPQAFVLTAIVITLAVTVFLLALAVIGRNDNTHRVPETGEEHDR